MDACTVRKATRFSTMVSTCSTTTVDWQSGMEESGEASDSDCDGSLVGQVWPLSQQPRGSRQVQDALEAAPSDAAREALAEELHGYVTKAMRCPHANHVLQKCIAVMRPESLQFIVDELSAREGLVVQAAKHRYACRVVQHTLSKCSASQTAGLVEALLRDATALASHTIGHYVLEQLFELGTEEQRYRLVRNVERNMHSIGLSTPSGGVIRTVLGSAAPEDKIWIARAVLQHPEVLLFLAVQPRGNHAVLLVLQTLQDSELSRARGLLLQHMDRLRSSKFGSVVAKHLVLAVELGA